MNKKIVKLLPLLLAPLFVVSCANNPNNGGNNGGNTALTPNSEELLVKYVNYDGTILQQSTIPFGKAIPLYEGETPHREMDATYFYVFDGWQDKYVDINTIQYKAIYKEIDYTQTDNYTWTFTDEEMNEVMLYVYNDAFRANEDVYIPDEIMYNGKSYPVTEIRDFAIDTHYAKRVFLGKNVKKVAPLFISDYASHSVGWIEVDPANPYLKSVDGVLYDHDMKTIIKAPLALNLETYVLPDTVETIAEMAFQSVEVIRNFETTEGSQLKRIENQAFCGASIQNVHLPYGLKTIGIRAFWLNDRIQTLTIPGSVEFLGNDADEVLQFASMGSLNTITFEEGIKTIPWQALSGCTTLSAVNLPSTLEVIEGYAFNGCDRVTSITLPKGVKKIGQSAFYGCRLSSVYTTDKEQVGSLTLPDGITEIEDWAFANNSLSGTVQIGKNVNEVGVYSFFGNNYITAYDVEKGNTAFSSVDGVLYDCNQKTALKLPNGIYGTFSFKEGIETIGENFLSGNSTITKVNIPSTLKKIDKNAFAGSIITEINLNEGLTEIGDSAFQSTKCLDEISFPSTLEKLDEWVFSGSSVEKVNSWGGIKEIGSYCFYNAHKLKEVNLVGADVEIINNYAFYSAEGGVENFTANEKLTTIDYALTGCSNLKSYDLSRATKITTLPTVFAGYINESLKTLILPSSLTKMEHDALGVFKYLNDIKFTGTKEQWNALVEASLLTVEEMKENQNWGEWYGTNYSTITSITVNYGKADQHTYSVNIRSNDGMID